MTQFCDTCPAKGSCSGQITSIEAITTTVNNPWTYWLVEEDKTFTYVDISDVQGNSHILRTFGTYTVAELIENIGSCQEPELKRSILFRKEAVCTALGRTSAISLGKFEFVKSVIPIKERFKRWKQEWREAGQNGR